MIRTVTLDWERCFVPVPRDGTSADGPTGQLRCLYDLGGDYPRGRIVRHDQWKATRAALEQVAAGKLAPQAAGTDGGTLMPDWPLRIEPARLRQFDWE